MRLMMVARRYPPDVRSGTETVFENLYQQARRRHEVRLVVGFRNARELVPAEAAAVDLRGLSRARAWARMGAMALREEARFRPDVVLSNSIEVFTRRAPVACIVHDLNFGSAERSLATRGRELFYRLRGKGLATVITVSEATRQRLLEGGIPANRVVVIHNGVDLEAFHPVPPRPDDGTVRFAYPSRIIPGKGQHLAIDALARLRKDHLRRARLTIVGAAPDRLFLDQLRVQAARLPVEIHTDVEDIVPYYQAADVILFPSMMDEGFGFTAIEGMACGKPVIWFDQPAVREATGGVGVPVVRGDVDGLRDAMAALMDDPALRAELGEAGRRLVEERYDWSRVWSRYEEVLERLAVG